MKRGDAAVLSISAVLATVVVAAVAYSLLVLDREPNRAAKEAVDSTSSLLVVTWGPSLCEVEPSNPGCRSGHVGRMGQSFVLHGLWPQPSSEQYCDIPKKAPARNRAPVTLPPDLQQSLQSMMSDSSIMTSHEWYAHGTCSGLAAPEYFGVAAALAGQVDDVLGPLFDKSAGRKVSSRSLRETFDAEFGGGAGKRVGLTCRDVPGRGSVVYEVQLSLPPVVDLRAGNDTLALREALSRGPAISAGCASGQVP